jgi:membrane protein
LNEVSLMDESAASEEPKLRTPRDLDYRDWRGVAVRVWNGIGTDNISLVAAGCAFYALLAIVPSLSALVVLYGLIADPAQVQEQVAGTSGLIPAEVQDILVKELSEMATASPTGLSWGLAITMGFALWYASAAVKSLILALNIALKEEETRGVVRFNLVGVALTILLIAGVILALVTIVGVPAVLAFLGLDEQLDFVLRLVRWPILAIFVVLGLAVLYRLAPCRASARWRWISHGAVLATLIWLAASVGFSLYVSNFGNYNATFGSLGAVVVVLFWLYISAFVIILGARLNGEIEHATAVDTTSGRPRPMGQRGAFFADRVVRKA